jgi:uncharacterized RDD family membrane protein YckC
MSAWGKDSEFLVSRWLKLDIMADWLGGLLLMAMEEGMRLEIWPCMFGSMLGISPWFTLLFSSARASQKALWVMKLSLLHAQTTNYQTLIKKTRHFYI